MTRTLCVYLNRVHIGNLIERHGKRLSFEYIDGNSKSISLSMPAASLKFEDGVVRSFFENLLPEGDVLDVIAKLYRVSKSNPFSLLNVIGEDCAGAIQLSSDLVDENQVSSPLELSAQSFKELLENFHDGNPYYEKGMRLSLAGVQNKTTLRAIGDQLFVSDFFHPSTHIIKFDQKHFKDILENELFCNKLAKQLKLNVSDMALKTHGSITYLWIKRFDRTRDIRIHQEDFCQILGIRPGAKYQHEGGPSYKQIVLKVKQHLPNFSRAVIDLAKIMIFNYLIGNCDYHGKNLSILYQDELKLAPFYDLVSTRIYEDLSMDMAMSINGIYHINQISSEDMIKELNAWQLNGKRMFDLVLNEFKDIHIFATQLLEKHPKMQALTDLIGKQLEHLKNHPSP